LGLDSNKVFFPTRLLLLFTSIKKKYPIVWNVSINKVAYVAVVLMVLISGLNFSLEANLVIYMNRTMSPPKKIKNKIYENHLDLTCIHIIRHNIIVWARINARVATGWEVSVIKILIRAETITSISGSSLRGQNFNFGS